MTGNAFAAAFSPAFGNTVPAPATPFSTAFSTAFASMFVPTPPRPATSAPVLDERPHRDALTAMLAPLLDGHVYDYGKVPGEYSNPGTLPGRYALLTVSRTFLPPLMMTRRPHRSGWRATIRSVGQTIDEARWVAARVYEALDGQRTTVEGHETTPITHETSDDAAPDDGFYSAATTYVYVLANTAPR